MSDKLPYRGIIFIMTHLLKKIENICFCLYIFFFIFWGQGAWGDSKVFQLNIGYKTVNFAHNKSLQALAINDQIPGPTLHFKEGEEVTLDVFNHLKESTTLHWHGLFVPWHMDGVANVSQIPIPPGKMFRYKFKLKQSGTYWYHSHTGSQEQRGLYGGLIIDPLIPPPYTYDRDVVVVLSDWSNTLPNQIYRNLKKNGEFYSSKFPLQSSLVQFLKDYTKASSDDKIQILDAYLMLQHTRMGIYDFSDVAYDSFLLNGHPSSRPWTASVKVGDVVRLRFIGAGASTIFRIKIPHTLMKVVHIQGNDVVPYEVEDFTLTPGETLDVLVKIQKEEPYIIYAESSDASSSVVGALVSNMNQKVDYKVSPFPTPKPTTPMMMSRMMKYEKHPELLPPLTDLLTEGTKYQNLKSSFKTNDPTLPVEVIKMTLSGYMDKYIWFLNDIPAYEAMPILIEPGKRYRMVFLNKSMMHHPMHIHGHFFILRNGHGAYDPFLHTIDVPPGAIVVADLDANASGQWFFHCHNMYHTMAGMSHIVRYTTFEKDSASLQDDTKNISPLMFTSHPRGRTSGVFSSTLFEAAEDPFHDIQRFTLTSLIGPDYHKLQINSEGFEIDQKKVGQGDVDIFYWHLISQFWALKGGVNYFYRPARTPYWRPGIGIEGLMPYFIGIESRAYYHQGSFLLDTSLQRDTQITNNFFIRAGIEGIFASKTIPKAEIGRGLNEMIFTI